MTRLIPESLESQRLILAMPQPGDWLALHAYYSDVECARYTFQQPLPESETQRVVGSLVRHWERKGYGPYVVREKQSTSVVGLVGLWFPSEWPETEIKWAIIREHWGKGYASEAARAVLAMLPRYLPDMQPISLIDAENDRSIALAKALGAELELELTFRNAPFHRYRHRRIEA
ncbi:MAG: GNAT family N-acetyltransferase [Sulfuritalea sp.]|jgi:RimJ/RimL family protein N-acetyltransferase|nr:GNAT family N-acetyltransferase [Sulfuritalea sp.]